MNLQFVGCMLVYKDMVYMYNSFGCSGIQRCNCMWQSSYMIYVATLQHTMHLLIPLLLYVCNYIPVSTLYKIIMTILFSAMLSNFSYLYLGNIYKANSIQKIINVAVVFLSN